MDTLTLDPRHQIGGNLPPHLVAFEAHKANIADLYAEAKNWLDGEPITTQGQHDAVEQLLDMIRDAERAADESRVLENKPFDEGKAEVQARYAPLIADTKSVKGMTVLAAEACKAALRPWREEQARLAAEKAKAEREEANRKALEAAEAIRASQADLSAREAAEALLLDAAKASKAADRAERTATVGTGLRSYWRPVLADPGAALRHYATTRPDEIKAALLRFAEEDVRAGKRAIPGFDVVEEKRAV